jgi:lysosomal acid phosphatase
LGQWLSKRYESLLSKKYSKRNIYVLSSDVDRCLMSAESNMAGVYPPEGDQQWNPDLKWQPVPIHTIPIRLDNVSAALHFEIKKSPETPQDLSYTCRYDPKLLMCFILTWSIK